MNNNFKISPFVKLNLLYNGKPTYISVFDICQIYEDTSGKGEEGVRILFKDDTYTFVEGPLDKVMYAIDEVLNPDWYKEATEEESRPLPDVTAAKAAARILKRFCSKSLCGNCIFHESDFRCTIKGDYPVYWDIPKGDE